MTLLEQSQKLKASIGLTSLTKLEILQIVQTCYIHTEQDRTITTRNLPHRQTHEHIFCQ